jgi:hypothetical protein
MKEVYPTFIVDTKDGSEDISRTTGMQAFIALRDEAKKNGVQDLTLDEINEEIRQVRYRGE